MTKRFFSTNIQILALAVIVFLAMVVGATWFFLHLNETAQTYQAQVQLIADTNERERTRDQLEMILLTSAEERAELEEYFLDVVQIAQFLELVEGYAADRSLVIESRDLYTTPPDDLNIATVRIPYEVYGPRPAVTDFIEMMETLPYHSDMQSLRTRAEPNGRMAAELEISISYITYD